MKQSSIKKSKFSSSNAVKEVHIFICFSFLEDSADDDESVPDIEIDIPPGKC